MSSALIVFAKVPEAGRVKTRLTPPLTPAQAAGLYGAFLRDALDAYVGLAAEAGGPAVRLYLAPEGPDAPPDLLPPGATLHAQLGDGLGERMLRAFVETFQAGHGRAVVVGTDHPTLPLAFVRLAFEELTRPMRIALGPSADGGYYLLGMNELYPQLFQGMAYSHGGVFRETMQRAAGTGAGVVVLPEWYDVDTAAALARLLRELAADAAVPAPRTREAVAKLGAGAAALS